MSKFLSGFKAFMCVAAAFLCGGAWADAGDVISINFYQENSQKISGNQTTAAGVIPADKWNDLAFAHDGNTTTTANLSSYNPNTQTATQTDVVCKQDFRESNLRASQNLISDSAYSYLKAALVPRREGYGGKATVDITSIPYEKYDVVLYFFVTKSDNAAKDDGQQTSFHVSTTGTNDADYSQFTVGDDGTPVAGSTAWGRGSDRTFVLGQNTAKFSDLTASEFHFKHESSNCGLCAIQIIDRTGAKKSMSINFCENGQPGAVSTLQTTAIGAVPASAWKNTNQGGATAKDVYSEDRGGCLIEGLTVWNGVNVVQEDSTKSIRFGVQNMNHLWYETDNSHATALTAEYSYLSSALCHKVGDNYDANIYVMNTGADFQYYDVIVYLSAADIHNKSMESTFTPIKINNQWYKGDESVEGTKTVSCGATDTWGEAPVTSANGGQLGKTAIRVNGLSGTLHVWKAAQKDCGISAIQIIEASEPPVAMIGEQGFESLAAALEDATEGQTVVLCKSTEENITIPAAVVVDTNHKTLTGTLNGEGKIIYRANASYDLPTVTLGDDWTGTCAFAGYCKYPNGVSAVSFNPDSFANENSKIEFNGALFSLTAGPYTAAEMIVTDNGLIPGLAAPAGLTIYKKLSGAGTINADVTINVGATIDVTGGTPKLADGKLLTFPEGELNLIGVTDGASVISVATAPTGLLTVTPKINGEASGRLSYDSERKAVVYSVATTIEVVPDTDNPDNLDSAGNFIWTSGAIWKKGDDVVELPEGARIVFDAATVHGVIIANQISADEIIVRGEAGSSFVFHNSTGKVDGNHEINDEIDCLTASSINVETFNGVLGLRVPIKGSIVFGSQTTLKFIAGADEVNPSKAYDYAIEGSASAIKVALDGEAAKGWFVVPESMYNIKFAPESNAVTLVYEVNDGEKMVTSPIYNAGNGSIKKTGAGTLNLTANMPSGAALVAQEGTLKYSSVESAGFKGSITVAKGATLINTKLEDLWWYNQTGISLKIYGTFDLAYTRLNVNNNQSWDIYGGATIKGFYQAGSEGNKSFDFADGNGLVINFHADPTGESNTITWNAISRFRENDVTFNIEDGVTVIVNADQFNHGGARTLTKTGLGILKFENGGTIDNHVAVSEGLLDLTELTNGNGAMKQDLKVGLNGAIKVPANMTKQITLIDPETTVLVETTNPDGSKTYTVLKKLVPGTATDPQPTKPTDEELARYAPVPVNAEAEAAGQSAIIKVVSKQTAEGWVITVDLDETKMPEGKKVDDTALAFANEGLAEIAGSTEGQEISIPATAVTPGAYYSVIYGDSPTALSSEGDRSLATSEGVTITVPAMTGKKVQFFRVRATAFPTANE